MMMTRPSTRDKLITSWWVQQRRDLYYLGFILLLVIYHQYTTHSTLLQNSQFLSAMEPETWRNVETLSSSSSSLSRYNESTTTMDLSQLTKSSITSCPPPLLYIPNYHGHSSTTNGRKIPYTIHMTSKSRCFSTNFYDNIQFWRTLAPTIQQRGEQQGQEQQQQQQQHPYSIYLHDDDAVNRLLSQNWELFPHMNLARKCLRSGAGLADLWRYLVLWEYGGIYTDIDNAPGRYWATSNIQEDDDAFFVIETLGVLSQYFLAVSPKHPLMYFCVLLSLQRILAIDHVGKQNIPVVTGPGALKVAFKYFMRTQHLSSQDDQPRYGRVQAGKYYGVGNRSVTVIGTKDTGSQWIIRGSVDDKILGYGAMGMKHFSTIAKKKFNESCLAHLWNLEFQYDRFNATNW